jgi:thymidylate kinase
VDLLVHPQSGQDLERSLAEAGRASGYCLVQRTRHVSTSYVFWHASGFLRVDVQREVRWRVFPVLSADPVLNQRRKSGDFYIPHPRHESVILWVAAIWRGQLSDRYQKRLADLYRQLAGPDELREAFQAAFGAMAEELVRSQESIVAQAPRAGLWRAARRAIIRNAVRPSNFLALLGYMAEDAARLWARIRHPPGASLICVFTRGPAGTEGTALVDQKSTGKSSSPELSGASERSEEGVVQHLRTLDDLQQRLDFLFPRARSEIRTFSLTAEARLPGPGLVLRLRRLVVLLRGGLFLRVSEAPTDPEIRKAARAHPDYLYRSRSFIWIRDSRGWSCASHAGTGFMTESERKEPGSPNELPIIRLMVAVLGRVARLPRPEEEKGRRDRGAFMVLLGLDGSGKTTVARQLCCLAAERSRFMRIRYFHWQPKVFGPAEFPLPEYRNLPRKPELSRNFLRACLSAARLFKNLLLATLAYWLRVRPGLRRNSLVVVDRYFYNYFLDPVSVKYYGPGWLLERVRRLFPRPELLVVLKAPAAVLLARKQELSSQELERQNVLLDQLRFESKPLVLDASQPAVETARKILEALGA